MRLNIFFLLPAIAIGYWFGHSNSKRTEPPELPRPNPVAAIPDKTDPSKIEPPRPKELSAPPPKLVIEPISIGKALQEKSRVPRLLVMLDMVLKCEKSKLKDNLEHILAAYKNGMLDKSDFSLICEAIGSRCDSDLITGLISTSGFHPEFQKSVFKGWAETDSKGASLALLSGKFNTDKNFPTREAFEGVVSSINGDAEELNQIRQKFSQAITLLETISATSDARRFGISATSQSQIKLLFFPQPADDKIKGVISFRLGVLADVAGGIDEETFVKYIDTSINSGTDLGLGNFSMGQKFAQRDFTKAWQYGLTLPPGDTRTNFLSIAVYEAGKKDPDTAIKFIAEMPSGSKTEQEMLIRNLEGSFRKSPAVDKAELPGLLEQTQALIQTLRAK